MTVALDIYYNIHVPFWNNAPQLSTLLFIGKETIENKHIENIDSLHKTDMGMVRIRRNLGLGDIDVVAWFKRKILETNAVIERHGKNWYVHIDGCIMIFILLHSTLLPISKISLCYTL